MTALAELWTCPGYWTRAAPHPYHVPCWRQEYMPVGERPASCLGPDLSGGTRPHDPMVSQGLYEFEEGFA